MRKRIFGILQSYFKLDENKTTVRTEILDPVVGIIPSAATAPALIFMARYAFMTLG